MLLLPQQLIMKSNGNTLVDISLPLQGMLREKSAHILNLHKISQGFRCPVDRSNICYNPCYNPKTERATGHEKHQTGSHEFYYTRLIQQAIIMNRFASYSLQSGHPYRSSPI